VETAPPPPLQPLTIVSDGLRLASLLFRSLALLCPVNGASLLAGLDEMETLEGAGDPDMVLDEGGHHGPGRSPLVARDARLREGARGLKAPASPHGLRWATVRGSCPATFESA